MFYGSGSDSKKFAKKTDVEKTECNNLMVEAMTQKSLTRMRLSTIGTSSMIKFHDNKFYGKIPTVQSPRMKTMTLIGCLKHVSG